MKKAVWMLEICLFFFLSIPLGILPLRLSLKAGELYGLLLFYLWGSRRKIALQNLKNSILSNAIIISEPIKKIIRDNFKNLGKSFAEIIKIYYGLGNKIIDSVSIEGIENFDEAKSKGKGILLITGHCGNWELMSIASTSKILRTAIVARPINNPYINKFIENVRQKYGNYVIYKQAALKPIIKTLKDNGSVGILMDQAVISDEGYIIDFLGRGAWTTKMPALIARKTGATVLPAFIHRTSTGHKIEIYPGIELSKTSDMENAIKEDTSKFSGFIEKYIKEHPKEWLWIHRRWKRTGHG
jgi:Kdo2-lipid IVA lauroyltransferase/acyltransferase